MHPDIVVCELLAVEAVAGKDKLKAATVTDGEKEFTVVSNAPNVLPEKVGKRIVVARVGAEVSGLDEPVKKANVGGVVSEGMLCDERMLWGKSAGTAVYLDDYDVGSQPPPQKPRPKEHVSAVAPIQKGEGLFEKKEKLSKEEKKARAKAEREARKARKAAKKDAAADDATVEEPS
jgi:tRNA-binding EMAP/Myf-like protein